MKYLYFCDLILRQTYLFMFPFVGWLGIYKSKCKHSQHFSCQYSSRGIYTLQNIFEINVAFLEKNKLKFRPHCIMKEIENNKTLFSFVSSWRIILKRLSVIMDAKPQLLITPSSTECPTRNFSIFNWQEKLVKRIKNIYILM